jgi:Spy/CpxP family protein refolding chaperone
MWLLRARYIRLLATVALILSANLVFAQSPSVNVSLANNDSCGRDVTFHLSGFTPNSPIIVDNDPNVIQEYECDGTLRQGAGWTGWDIGQSTDGNGNLSWAVRHGGYGSYLYIFHDGAGLTAGVSLSYASSYAPTEVPPTTAPATDVPPTVPPADSPTTEPTSQPTSVPPTVPSTLVPPTIPPTLPPPTALPPCPSGTGPGGITAGSYPPQDLTQEQRQWLWNIFGNNPNEQAPVGYGGQGCSGGSTQPPLPPCPSGTGPGGITAGSYPPQDLTQEQRQWLWNIFGNNPNEQAPVGYGGQGCSGGNTQPPLPPCPSGTGPGGITAGSYSPQELTQEQRQWLWNIFGNNPNEQAPVGYGGQGCSGGNTEPPLPECPAGVGPGNIKPGSYLPQDLTQEQRQWLWNIFGNNPNEQAPVGYGGQACNGGGGTIPETTDEDTPTNVYLGYSERPQFSKVYMQVIVDQLRFRVTPSTQASTYGYLKRGDYYVISESTEPNYKGWGKIQATLSGQVATGWTYLDGYTTVFTQSDDIPDDPAEEESGTLGRNCVEETTSVICTAIGVNGETNNPNDPFAGIFEVPTDKANAIEQNERVRIRFRLPVGVLFGSAACGVFPEGASVTDARSGDILTPQPGFRFVQGCVRLMIRLTPNATDPQRWTLRYTK